MSDRSSDRTQDTAPPVADPEGGSEIHSATAARQFLRAVRHDLAALLRRVASSPPKTGAGGWGRQSKRGNRKLLMAFMIVAVSSGIGLLMVAGTMLWVLHDLPLDEASAKGGNRSIALEAGDGKPLGRIGSTARSGC